MASLPVPRPRTRPETTCLAAKVSGSAPLPSDRNEVASFPSNSGIARGHRHRGRGQPLRVEDHARSVAFRHGYHDSPTAGGRHCQQMPCGATPSGSLTASRTAASTPLQAAARAAFLCSRRDLGVVQPKDPGLQPRARSAGSAHTIANRVSVDSLNYTAPPARRCRPPSQSPPG